MSVYYYLVCEEEKEDLWVGQNGYIWTSDEDVETLEAFLYKHVYCDLKMVNEDSPILEETKRFIMTPKKEEFCYQDSIHIKNYNLNGKSVVLERGNILCAYCGYYQPTSFVRNEDGLITGVTVKEDDWEHRDTCKQKVS